MLAETPILDPAITAVLEYANTHQSALTTQHVQILLEIVRRLERLKIQATELIVINNRLWSKEGLTIDFDPENDTLTMSMGGSKMGLRLNRADPDVPIEAKGHTAIGAYHAGKSEPVDEEIKMLRIELEEKLESYYQSAHRVLKLLGRIPGLSKVRCLPVTRVRNDLIEHPDDGTLYSFGVGSTGPLVKPIHQGNPKFLDKGLTPNTQEFVKVLVSGCRDNTP